MAALSAATAIVAVVVPFAAGLSLLGTVPLGLLAYRYRLRVLVAATIAGSLIAFLVAGMGGMMTVVECAYIGCVDWPGQAQKSGHTDHHRGWGPARAWRSVRCR